MDLRRDDHPVFKICPMCGFRWESRESFLTDPSIAIIGYQACFTELTAGYFLFNHSCAGTLAILVEAMLDLYHGPVYAEPMVGSSECPQHCLHEDELAPRKEWHAADKDA